MVARHTGLCAVTIIILSSSVIFCNGQTNTIISEEVMENQKTGSVVYRFQRPPSGQEYKLIRSYDEDTAYRLFAVSSDGAVTTQQPLVYTIDRPNKYALTIVRRPQGQDEGGIAWTLEVTVKDIDNYQPTFGANVYEGRVREGSPANTIVDGLEKCFAEDRDTSGIDQYKIVSGNEKKYFQIETVKKDRTFVVLKTTNVPIVRDPDDPYITLTVQAKQARKPAKIKIYIEDANDNEPKFAKSSYTEIVDENAAVQSSVVRVTANDPDVGTNGGLYYYLQPLNDYFMVDAITGLIKVAQTLDYAKGQSNSLTLYARDRGNPTKSSSTTVTVNIQRDIAGYPPPDSSDPGTNTKPIFPQDSYTTSIREDFPIGGVLLLINAVDNDPPGPNKRLTYTLSGSGSTDFNINSGSGLVTLAKTVDYKLSGSNQYTLNVRAQDGNGLTADTQLIIDVLDVDENYHAPRFNPQQKLVEVSEDVAKGTSVTTVSATDQDTGGPDKQIVYSIIQGSGMGIFKVDPNTGEVQTDALLDREGRTWYDMVIKAEDKATFPKSGNLYLMVNVKDKDDNNPFFTEPMYVAKVPEKAPENTFVTVVRAEDPDKNPTISYSITNSQTAFKIESSTGVIRTRRSLEISRGEIEFELTIQATSSGKTAAGQVNVTVTSRADSAPTFMNTAAYKSVSVPENQGPVSNILCIAAVDSSLSPVAYQLSKLSSELNVFAINKNSGRLSSTKSFNYDENDQYQIQVEAQSLTSKKTASADIVISVLSQKDPPTFSKQDYSVSVLESKPVGTTIRTGIKIIDQDTAPEQFICSLENINDLKILEYLSAKRDGDQCNVVTKKTLDTSVTPQFQFAMRATDKNLYNLYAQADVTLEVKDENNNDPVFSQTSYWVSVYSDIAKDANVLTISATDRDKGTFGEVTYQLVTANNWFDLDVNTGVMSTASKLTVNTVFEVKVKATDGGGRAAEVVVKVSSYDRSDTPVKFDQDSYTASILEDKPLNTEVVRVTATKSGSSSGITYELVGGYKEGGTAIFRINGNGQVFLDSSLDRERKSSYTLIIRAKHSGGSIELVKNVECVVTVGDVNNKVPQFTFEKNPKYYTVDNYSPADTVFGRAKAIDLDAGNNGKVTYSIDSSSGGINLFKIDGEKGTLMTKTKLTKVETYTNVVLVASDGGSPQKTSKTTVTIEVVKAFPAPKFKESSYSASVQENARVGELVTTVKAEYDDSSAFLQYSFLSGNTDSAFCVDSNGKITVARPLDREKVSQYTLKLQVARGKDKATSTVVISVTDINDDSPVFEKNLYQFKVKENAAISTTVGKVVAKDFDSGSFGEVTYKVLQSVDIESKDMFQVGAKSGIITTQKTLDYEDIKKHILFIKAEDNGMTRLGAVTEVQIEVEDVNDNPPKFSAPLYRAKVALDAAVGHHVVQVAATDLDSPKNAQPMYSVVSGNDEKAFEVNRENGLITVAKSLTTVAADKFILRIKAKDRGDQPKSDEVNVEINVFLPDGPPKFVVSPIVVKVTEGLAANKRVAVAKAATSEALKYEIISGNTNGMFKINPATGVILTTRELDYEEATKYSLIIVAMDTRDRRAQVEVNLQIINTNDNKPMFPGEIDGQIDRKVSGPFSKGVVVTSLAAIDKDQGDMVKYKLSPPSVYDNFDIDSQGQLIAKGNLRNIPSPYRYKIIATDSGSPAQVSTADVRMVFVNYRPKQQPVRAMVPESTPVGSNITRVPKYFPSGVFEIIFPEKSNFTIDNKGIVRLVGQLDFEKQAFHLITVREKQTVDSKLTNDVDVEIYVLDLNDNKPYFTMTSLKASINRNARAGANVFQLSARDLDSGSNGQIGYQLLNSSFPFTINPFTSKIEVGKALLGASFRPEALPFDYGKPGNNGSKATINIETTQTPPIFSRASYQFTVSERAPIGYSIGKIEARSASGARLDFKIKEGDPNNRFFVKSDGTVVLNSLMKNSPAQFKLKVEAIEQIPNPLSSTVEVVIDVLNGNDFYPYFEKLLYTVTLSEDQGIGSVIVTVKALDCDCSSACQCKRGLLKYQIEPREYFVVDEDTGQVMISKTLDFETKTEHLLKVSATDTGVVKYTAAAYVFVTVTNTNDNKPVFSSNAYEFRVTENAETTANLGAVVASDDDGGQVDYSIISGSEFKIISNTGVLRLSQSIPKDNKKNEFTVTVRAKDQNNNYGPDAVVRFNVDHVNTVRPTFTSCGKATVQEHRSKGQVVTKVEATDNDKGRYGEVEFSLQPVGGQNFFKINNRTGEITTTASLDREKRSSYTVIVRAEDGGHGKLPEERLLTYCFLTVEVLDTNDNSPKFEARPYIATTQIGQGKGKEVVTVNAVDADVGTNAKIRYSLKTSSDKFTIDQNSGTISTKVDLKSQDVGKVLLTVACSNVPAAQDSQTPEHEKETVVEIYISDQPPPKCKEPKGFLFEVSEAVATGEDVGTIVATAQAPGSSIVRYSPVKANSYVDERFSVSPSTGKITTAAQLDYEALPQDDKTFRLQVRAQQDGTNLFTTCEVTIRLTDVNDDKPTFDLGSYDARVLENAKIGTTVVKIMAKDRDHGSAGEVQYSIVGNDPNFQINSATGVITTRQVFDRETKDVYSITVQATDKGTNPGALSEEVTVRILIVDQNDNGPKFSKPVYTVSIPENIQKGTVVYSELEATDKDIGDNALITYFISGGDMSGTFTVNTVTGKKTYGALVVNRKLDYEKKKTYQLQVSASDGMASASATIDVTISNINDVAPKFQNPVYATKVAEGKREGVFVLRLTATDVDSTAITYSLQSSAQGFFTIRTEKTGSTFAGIIETGSTKLDREKTPLMTFEVYASDGQYKGKAEVQINVTDINDSPPRFPDDQVYVGYILENVKAGSSVMYVQAVDDDFQYAGGNADIKYDLTNNAGNSFKINPNTGLVSSLKVFNRDTDKSPLTITVRATDQGKNPQSATRDATIFILDGNNHKPEFTKTVYRGTVPEHAPPGYRIAAVSATDKDTGPNAELEYVVESGNDPHVFYLDPYNGTVHVSGIIDFEVKRSYELTVKVSDRGVPVLAADKTAKVIITVTDTNDNPPVFSPKEYKKSVPENIQVGTVIVKVTASDADSGNNAKFDFSITKGDPTDLYEIVPDSKNPNIGLIKNRLPLDRETTPVSELEVTATDTGGLQGKARAVITIDDVNDNGPWFVPPYFEGKIKENIDNAQFVTRLSAYDPDTTANGKPFTYSIYNGTVNDNFKLVEPATLKDVTSNMNSYGRFNREEKSTWKIGVTAVDNGNPKKSNFTYVYVDVEDENDNEPFDGSLKIVVNAFKGQFLCGSIGKPYYQDNDFDGDVNTYTIETQKPGNYFKIDPNTGIMTADKEIPMGRYTLSVKITETNRGSNTKSVRSMISVSVRRVDPDAVKSGVTLQFLNLRKVEYFVGDYYEKTVDLIGSFLEASIEMFSIQKASNNSMAVNVHFAAKKGGSYVKPLDVINNLSGKKKEFNDIGLEVGSIGIDACAMEKRKVGKCINEIEPSSKCTVASGDYGKVPAPTSSISVVSMDVTLKDKYVSVITPQGKCATSNPCRHGGTCHDSVPYGYMLCQCAREYRGPHCEVTTRTFYGNSLIWLPKLSAYDLRDISFEFMTEKPDGLMLYQGPLKEGGNNGEKDFLAVFLQGGYVVMMVSFGSEPTTISVTKGPRLDDKEWHVVTIKRDMVDRKLVRLIIDRCEKATIVEQNGRVFENRDNCEASKKVFGQKTYLNGFGPLQIGGVDTDVSWLGVKTKGFDGCIRKIIDYETMYDLQDQPLKVVNSVTGCQPAATCPNCNNNGYCEPGLKKSICVCDIGYMGSDCTARSPANYYKANSFSQYLLNSARARRDLVQPPKSLTNEFYTSIALKVKIDRDMENCVIFLSSNSLGTEFNRIDLKDRVLRYIFRLGDRLKILSIPQMNITDGKYHTVVVKREGNYASMQIDYDGLVAGNTGGINKLLNMGGGSFFSGGLPNITEVRVIEAIVRSGGNTVLRTADGRVLASGIGTDGSGGMSFGTGLTSTMITVMPSGKTVVDSFSDPRGLFVSGMGVRGISIDKTTQDGKEIVEVYNGRRTVSGFGTAIGAQGNVIKNKYPSTGPYIDGVPIYNVKGTQILTYGGGIPWTLETGTATSESKPVAVIGDFGGCTASNRFNGVDLDKDDAVDIRRQNVDPGCPCTTGFCKNGGSCVNGDPPYCICPPGFIGTRCETVVTKPNAGQRPGSRMILPGVLALILVVVFAVLAIMLFVFLKKRAPPPVVPVTLEDGHVHDNIRPYHDDGAGEEDNFGYDITQLMKYTYVEGGGGGGYGYGAGGGYGKGGGAGYGGGGGGGGGNGNGIEENITVAEDKPLLQGAFNGNGQQFGVTTITRRRVINPDSMDVGNFINQRVGEANGEYFIAHDSLHMFRYEGDDSDVDDLSELGDSDNEEDDDEQSFDFLQRWGRKFESLNRIYNIDS